VESASVEELVGAIEALSAWGMRAETATPATSPSSSRRTPGEFLAAASAPGADRNIAALEDLEARLHDMARRFERLETVFDSHFADVGATRVPR